MSRPGQYSPIDPDGILFSRKMKSTAREPAFHSPDYFLMPVLYFLPEIPFICGPKYTHHDRNNQQKQIQILASFPGIAHCTYTAAVIHAAMVLAGIARHGNRFCPRHGLGVTNS